jgi:uncharacterized SAM-binding protein YcdF (DUF218 family)
MLSGFSSIFGWLIIPSNVILTLGLVGLVLLLTQFAFLGRRLLIIGYLLLALGGISPLAYGLLLPLEDRFPRWDPSLGAPSGIIVLGGAIDADVSAIRGEVSLSDAAERLTAIAELARRYPAAKIVFSGGSGDLQPSEAKLASRLFESFGISPDRILTEDSSLNTAQNASFSKNLIEPKATDRWLLVTSAAHMPRAIGAFRNAGFQVEAYPVDWHTTGRQDLTSMFRSPLTGLYLLDVAAHEWIGLLAYWLNGRTSSLFPGP